MSDDPGILVQLGMKMPDLIAGFAGGIVNAFALKRSDPISIIGSMVVGALTANYLTDVVGHYTGTSGGTAAFLVGWRAWASARASSRGQRIGVHSATAGRTAMQIDRSLEGLDLTDLHTILTLAGMFLAIYVMQLTSHVNEDHDDPWLLRWSRRAALVSIALSMLWSLSYSQTKSWQPWPPEIALIIAVVAMLSVRALAIRLRIRRDGIVRRAALMSDSRHRPIPVKSSRN